jgi:hypothetical protein
MFEAIVHAIGRGAAAVVFEEVPVIGLSCRDAHALNDATKSASIHAMRMVFISRSRVPCPPTGPPCIMKPVSAGRTIGGSARRRFREVGAPCGIRTHGPRIRNPVLYPSELRGRPDSEEVTPMWVAGKEH